MIYEDETNTYFKMYFSQTVSEQMKLEGHQAGALQCKRKWANLAQGFQHHKAAVEATGTLPLWPFYTRVRHVMKVVGMPIPGSEICVCVGWG